MGKSSVSSVSRVLGSFCRFLSQRVRAKPAIWPLSSVAVDSRGPSSSAHSSRHNRGQSTMLSSLSQDSIPSNA